MRPGEPGGALYMIFNGRYSIIECMGNCGWAKRSRPGTGEEGDGGKKQARLTKASAGRAPNKAAR